MKMSLNTGAINWFCDNPEGAVEFLDAQRHDGPSMSFL